MLKPAPGDDYAHQIKSLRAKLGLTQVAFAEALGVSFPTVNRWENGHAKPSPLAMKQIEELVNKLGDKGQDLREA